MYGSYKQWSISVKKDPTSKIKAKTLETIKGSEGQLVHW